jgi:hypothetical protein
MSQANDPSEAGAADTHSSTASRLPVTFQEVFKELVRPIWEEALLNTGFEPLIWKPIFPWPRWLANKYGRWEPSNATFNQFVANKTHNAR